MKKILLAIMFVLLLTGCSEDSKYSYTEPPQDDWPYTVKYAFCSKNGNYSEPYCVEFWTEYDLEEGRALSNYYTQEEVDLMLQEQSTELLQFMVDNMVQYNKEDNAIYADCYIVDSIKYCDIVLDLDEDWALLTENQYQDLVTDEELNQMFTDYGLDIHSPEDFVNLFDDFEDYVAELETRIEELTPISDTLSLASEHYTVNVTLENGYITLFELCGNGVCENGTEYSAQRFLNFEEQIILDEMQHLLDTLEELHKLF